MMWGTIILCGYMLPAKSRGSTNRKKNRVALLLLPNWHSYVVAQVTIPQTIQGFGKLSLGIIQTYPNFLNDTWDTTMLLAMENKQPMPLSRYLLCINNHGHNQCMYQTLGLVRQWDNLFCRPANP